MLDAHCNWNFVLNKVDQNKEAAHTWLRDGVHAGRLRHIDLLAWAYMSLIRLISASICRGVFQQGRALSSTPAARGLEDFFDNTVKEGERVTVGVQIKLLVPLLL